MTTRLKAGGMAAAMIAALIAPVAAEPVRELGVFRDWASYAASDGAGQLCFALSKPTDVTPRPDGFTEAYLYITHRPAENVSNEFNLVAGYVFAADTPATVTVAGESYQLFTEKDAAWLDDASQSEALASVIRAGTILTVEGTSDKGIKITETFSLSGATAASKAIDGEC